MSKIIRGFKTPTAYIATVSMLGFHLSEKCLVYSLLFQQQLVTARRLF